ATKGPLVERIDSLAERSVITEVLRDWAHALRVDGNAAVHGFEGTREAAEELVEFIKLFLHVTFELPAAIEQRKAGKKPLDNLATALSSETVIPEEARP